jgi:hypothetical protein
LAIDVKTAISVFKAIAGKPGLSILKRFTNSAAIWDASQALPPLPNISSFLPSLKESAISLDTSAISAAFSLTNFPFIFILSSNALIIFFSINCYSLNNI